jgi:sigma-B regulation protein RsbU (phosphoserine phosphatase)
VFAPLPGLRWTVVAVVPEDEFLDEARRVQSRSILLGVAAVGAALVLAGLLSRRIVGPLFDLRRHVQRVGAGDFDSRLDLRAARELSEMSDALNAMTGQLKRHMQAQHAMAVAVEVQQSLLPHKSPDLDWIEVAGQTRYCDETGGDYYDYIELPDPQSKSLLVALGDVQGHGVSAALLMATARAALHAHALETPSLAELLQKVNRVLVRDTKKVRFMTLALMRLSPGTAELCWSSAGHDGPILYDPASDEFRELEGGDVPLGIMPGVDYQEYTAGVMPPGAVILVGTDGIWEARSPGDEMFGKDRLREIIRRHHAHGALRIAAELTRALEAFCAGRFEDDVTFVIARYR